MASGLLLRAIFPRVNPTRLLISGAPRSFLPSSTSTISRQHAPVVALTFQRTSSSAHADQDYSRMWTLERVIASGLLPVIPATIFISSPILDYALALLLTIHNHWSLEGVVHDYVRPRLYGDMAPKVAMGLLYLLSSAILGGLFYFNYSDVGIGNAIRMLWKL